MLIHQHAIAVAPIGVQRKHEPTLAVTARVLVPLSLCAPPVPVLPLSLMATVRVTLAVALDAVVNVRLPPLMKLLSAVSVPFNTRDVPLPLTVTPPPVLAERLPEGTEKVAVRLPAPASGSMKEMPVIVLGTSSVTSMLP